MGKFHEINLYLVNIYYLMYDSNIDVDTMW